MLDPAYKNVGCHSLGTWSQPALGACLCGLLYESLYGFDIKSWRYLMHEYNEDEEHYLIVLICKFIFFESVVPDTMMYSSLI